MATSRPVGALEPDERRLAQQPKNEKKRRTTKRQREKLGAIDIPMLTITLVLLLFGLVMLYSASYANGYIRYQDSMFYISSQITYAIAGIVAMFAASLVDYRILKKFAWALMALTVILLVVVLFMPARDWAHRWIWLNAAQTRSFQPSEIAKFSVILLFASLIAKHQKRMKTLRYGFLPFFLILGVVAGLLWLEPHLSALILIMGIGISMMFAGGASIKWFAIAGVAAGAVLFVVVSYPDLLPHAYERIESWLASINDITQLEYQTRQSMIAVGSGGLAGRGIGQSRQKFLYLPEMHNDYIFAVLCEELGFIGALAVILLFLLLLGRGIYIAIRARDKFGSMLALGISVQIALQAFLHIGVNINAIPSTGISMPFFSSGGSSLVMLLGEMGVLLSVSRGADLTFRRRQASPDEAPKKETGEPDRGPTEADDALFDERVKA